MTRRALITLALAAVMLGTTGCRTIMTTMAYLIVGPTVEADYQGLEKKTVLVVVRPSAHVDWGYTSVDKELAREIAMLLRTNVRKIKVVDHQKVANWLDENQWNEYTEVGEALKADMVLGIDLLEFGLYQGQTLYQGQASCNLTVYDMEEDGAVVFEKALPRTLYPPNTGIPAAEMPESQFRRRFISKLADQIGRHFYRHDPHADIGLDGDAIE
ncbi:MAG: hypothetical protein ACOY3P_08130 [Planctomycetota bacterium]